MNRAGRIVVVLAALALALALLSWTARPPPADQEEGLTARARQIVALKEEMRAQDLARGLVVVAATSFLLAGAGLAGSNPGATRAASALVGVASLYLLYQWISMIPVDSPDPDVTLPSSETWAVGLPVLLALLIASAVLLWFAEAVDGFSLGALVLAVAIEVVLFMGWVQSPQGESGNYFYTASCLPALLMSVTLTVNRLQRPK